MIYTPGSIVLLPFPFSDLSSTKVRPALIIYADESDTDMLLIPITSHYHKGNIPINTKNLSAGALAHASFLRYKKIMSIEKSLAKKRIGIVEEEFFKKIKKNIRGLFR